MKTKEEVLDAFKQMMGVAGMVCESGWSGLGVEMALHAIREDAKNLLVLAERLGVLSEADVDALIEDNDL